MTRNEALRLRRQVKSREVELLNDFANAIRECLGLEPLQRHTLVKAKVSSNERASNERRFYQEPYVWSDVSATVGIGRAKAKTWSG